MKWLKKSFFIFFFINITSTYAQVYLQPIYGAPLPFDSLKGKWVLINYWASWCQPCLDEINELNHFYEMNKDEVALFAVNFDKMSLPSLITLIRKYKINYPSLRLDPADLLDLGDIQGVPATFVFNKKGKLVNVLYGSQTIKSLNKALDKS